MRMLQIAFLLMFILMLQGFKPDQMKGATQMSGVITSFSIEEKRLFVGQTEYALSDHLYVVGKNNIVIGDRHLESGQQINFWVTYPSGELPTVIKIQMLADIKIPS